MLVYMYFVTTFVIIVGALFLGAFLVSYSLTGSTYHGAENEYFKDGEFFMPGLSANDKSFKDVLTWMWGQRQDVAWSEAYTTDTVSYTPMASSSSVRATFINHATVLIESKDLTLITDPIFTKRASPFSFLGPIRHHDPYLPLSAIPKLDIVLISHSHYDHLSLDSIKQVEEKFAPHYVVPLNNGQFLMRAGVPKERITELGLSTSYQEKDATITLEKAQHWTSRGMSDRNRYLWGSYVISIGGKTLYFAGDTGYNTHFSEVQEKYGDVDLAFIPIGAYEPRWFMKTQHLNPPEAVQAAKDLGAGSAMGIHFGTFKLTDEGRYDPEKDLLKALEESEYDGQFLVPTPSSGLTVSI